MLIAGGNLEKICSTYDAKSRDILRLLKRFLEFYIHHCNAVKLERLECHLYGHLISILLCSSNMFQMRQLLLIKKKQELSEYKAIYIIKDYFSLIYQSLQKDTSNQWKRHNHISSAVQIYVRISSRTHHRSIN